MRKLHSGAQPGDHACGTSRQGATLARCERPIHVHVGAMFLYTGARKYPMGRTCGQIHAFGAVESLVMFGFAVVKWISTSLTVTEELFTRDTSGKRVSFCVTECRCMAWPFEEPTEIRNLRFAYNIQEEKNSPRMSWRVVNHGRKKNAGEYRFTRFAISTRKDVAKRK